MSNNYEFDVALSFAGENRDYVKEVANHLQSLGIKVFFDEFEQTNLWGKNLYDYLQDIYTKKAKYTMMFISKFYKEKMWTNHERQSAQARAFQESEEYILPIKFDNTDIPGMHSTVAYLDATRYSPKEIADLFLEKNGFNHNDIQHSSSIAIVNSLPDKLDKKSKLLKEVSIDPQGTISLINAISGTLLQTNKKSFITRNTRREIAEWEEVLEVLVSEKLIVLKHWDKSIKIYEITNSGYKVADGIS